MLQSMELFLIFLTFCIHSKTDASSQQTSQFSAYEITTPKLINERQKRDVGQEKWRDQITYSVYLEGEVCILKLERNKKLLAKDFVQYVFDKEGNMKSSNPKIQTHCYFHGIVEGVMDSKVVLSTCSGVRGIILIGERSFGIEPLENSFTFEHLIYRLEDVQTEPFVCGVPHHSQSTNNDGHSSYGSLVQHLRKKRAVLPTTRFVELVLVVDNDKYNLHNRNETLIQEQMVELVHIVNGMYSSLNVRVILTGLVLWKDKDQIVINGTAGDVLGRFVRWRERVLIPEKRHDSGHLILGKAQFSGILGLAFVSTVCSTRLGGGIDVFHNSNVPTAATVLAHELGHNMGLSHDDQRPCDCPTNHCIMFSSISGSRNFSSCSQNDFVRFIERGGGLCLQNEPELEDQYSLPSCGNNIVDEGEECDCGTPQKCSNPCCNAATCRLTSGSQCAHGRCCENCRFRVAGTLCRGAANVCDLPEYCNGSSHLCQPDVFLQNGYPCANGMTYCYDGLCQTYDAQCKALFGSTSLRAPDVCFEHANLQGDRFGNCGFQNQRFKKCTLSNAGCGKIQCIKVTERPFGVDTSTSNVNGIQCVNADFHVGTDITDPSYVNTGTGCNKDKACINFACVNASNLGFDCDIKGKCNNRGVCNSNKNCHCDDGWAPPNCDTRGFGGSIDSGPTRIDTSLRDGLLIFFLLVVPVLVFIGLIIFFNRNAIKQRWRKRKAPHATTQNGRQSENNLSNQSNRANNQVISTGNTNVYSDITSQGQYASNENPVPYVAYTPNRQNPVPPPRPTITPQSNVPPRPAVLPRPTASRQS
ncbi:disintegrin and metalloproteinase domain-containing protein 9 [Stegostoma tigrinum]|uniref:disintegrin and metalloproteinase domain-containing protein 9 n=1 Tax=Stegostoma tigrinum TaxID=3053191 RepID=UPI00202ACC42|nr:disintegrin and metalloproteinase domain-containing protein 9 [Stegostoma tigrinum]